MKSLSFGKRAVSALIAAVIAASQLPAAAAVTTGEAKKAGSVAALEDCTKYVNTFVGTDVDGGQLFPGAVTPSGLVKLSPDTFPHDDNDHAGYDYSKSMICGFSHTRVEGVGGNGAGGDMLVTPTYIETNAKPAEAARAQAYSHAEEKAEPGFYEVMLTPKTGTGAQNTSIGKIKAELTTADNVGLHRYTFPKAGNASLVLDLAYGYNRRNGRNSSMVIKTDGDKTFLQGAIQARTVGDKTTYKLYYYAETNIPAASVKTWKKTSSQNPTLDDSTACEGADIGAVLRFNVADSGQVMLKVCMSTISEEQAKRDMKARLSGWDFEAAAANAKERWNDILSRVSVKTADRDALLKKYDEVYEAFYKNAGNSPDANVYSAGSSMKAQAELSEAQEDERLKTLFYTHLYHMFTTPVSATSSDGTYRVNSELVKQADDFTYYDSWSLWDDFRKYPVLGLVAPDIYKNQIKSIANLAEYGVGNLYGGSLSTNTVPTVRAEHAVALLADGVAKGMTDIDDLEAAYNKFKSLSDGYWGSANLNRGYFSGNVGNTVEYSYDDWAISLIARFLGKTADVSAYSKRALNYRNIFRPDALTKSYVKDGRTVTDKISILWPKDDNGSWRDSGATAADMNNKAEQYEYSGYQGTLWQYSLWDSYDAAGLMRLMGNGDELKGKQNLLNYMKYLYGMNVNDNASYSELQNAVLHSNTNEIDLQTPYMFNVAGKPSLTQYWTRQIYTKATWNRYSGTGRNNTTETNNQKPVYAYKLDPYGFMETMDDDCGTMAGNFVAAAMGLYPMVPGDTTFQITSPFFEEMTIDLGAGKSFTIKAPGVSSENFYIQSASLNGKPLDRSWIDYSEIARGGVLEFTMGSQPSEWAENGASVPSVDDLNGQSVADYMSEPSLEFSKTSVAESDADDGTIADTVDITAKNGAVLSGADGEDFVKTGKAVVHNLPKGLGAKIVRISNTAARLEFTGAAEQHDADADDLAIAFESEAFDGLSADEVVNSYKANLNALVIDFKTDLKAKLRDYVDSVKGYPASAYTAATFAKFTSALERANGVLSAESPTDGEYIAAYESLYTAAVQLAEKASAFDPLTAAQADKYFSCGAGAYVVNSKDGSYISYNARDFGESGVAAVTVKYEKASSGAAEDSYLELRKGGAAGELIKTIPLAFTSEKWSGAPVKCKAYFSDPKVLTGLQDVYAVFKSSEPSKLVCRLYEIEFTEAGSYRRVEAESYSAWSTDTNPYHSDVLKVENGGSGRNVGGTFDGAWLAYGDMNFSGGGLKSVSVNYAHNSGRCGAGAKAEFRLDSPDGELIATVSLPSTGSDWNNYKTASANTTKAVAGKHTVYVVLHADTNAANPFVSNIDYFGFTGNVDKTVLAAQIEAALQQQKPEKYTSASLKTLSEKIIRAEAVNADAGASQEQADAAADELLKAVNALERCVSSIKLSPDSLNMTVGQSQKITAAAYIDSEPVPGGNALEFISSDPAVAAVGADGTVTAVRAGTARITVRASDGSPAYSICLVKVSPKDAASVKLNAAKLTLAAGGKKQLSATVNPAGLAGVKTVFSSSSSKIAAVSQSGTITAKSPGKAVITVTVGTKRAQCVVTVRPAAPTKVKLLKRGGRLTVSFKKGRGGRYTKLVIYRNNKKYKTARVNGKAYSFKAAKPGSYKVKAISCAKVSGRVYQSKGRSSKKIKVK